jgi:hypothetical protein
VRYGDAALARDILELRDRRKVGMARSFGGHFRRGRERNGSALAARDPRPCGTQNQQQKS